MLGIGHRLQKQTKIKILAQKAKQYNTKYDQMLQNGVQPELAMKTLTKEQFNKRHQDDIDEQPYKVSHKINNLPGAVNLFYTQTHKIKSTTKAMFQPVQTQFQAYKSGTSSSGFNMTKTPEQVLQLKKIKQRIKKDHLQQDKQINLNDQIVSDYKKNFVHDEKMKQICQNKDMKFNQRKNDLKWYAETYIKTKDSLRK